MAVWDVTTPAGSDNINAGDDRIRELKVAIDDALESEDGTLGKAGSFPGDAPATAPEFAYMGHRGTTAQIAAMSANVSGLAFDTDKSAFYSYAGASWQAVANLIPAGTKMVFYQSTAPTGWTISTSEVDRILRVDDSGGGSQAGTWAALTVGTLKFQVADYDYTSGAGDSKINFYTSGGADIDVFRMPWTWAGGGSNDSVTHGSGLATSDKIFYTKSGTGSTGAHGSTQHAYATVRIATKDAY